MLPDLYRDTDIADTFAGIATNMLTGSRKKDFQLQPPFAIPKNPQKNWLKVNYIVNRDHPELLQEANEDAKL